MTMTTFILLLALGQPTTGEVWSGQVISSWGAVVLERDGQQFRAVNTAGLQRGDVLVTSAGSGSILKVGNSAFAYLGSDTRVELTGRQAAPTLHVLAGELRVVAPDRGVAIQLQRGDLIVKGGAFRISRSEANERIASDGGRGELRLPGAEDTLIDAGQEMRLMDGIAGAPMPASGEGWSIDVAEIQRRIMEDEMRRRRRIDADLARSGDDAAQNDDSQRRPPGATATNQTQTAAAQTSGNLGGLSATPGIAASAGLFADANQSTNQGQLDNADPRFGPNGSPFPGNIHIVTGETRYGLQGVALSPTEAANAFPGGNPAYFSIGVGAAPAGQVSTDFNTASSAPPYAINVPGFNAHVVRLDQYGVIDPALDPAGAAANNVGYAGLLGNPPTSPTVNGTAPLLDERAAFNPTATFAMGEFRVGPDDGNGNVDFAVRRSDQDRLIVKDGGGNDALDKVTPNPGVDFVDTVDPRFLPAAPTVKVPVPNSFQGGTRFSQLDPLRRGAATTVLADQLYEYAQRTGQTRFVIDGKVVDISGYRRP